MIRWKQAAMQLPDFGLQFGNPDFAAYAKSYGAYGYCIKNHGELRKTLRFCIEKKRVHLIEIPIDYSENESILIKELKQKTCLI